MTDREAERGMDRNVVLAVERRHRVAAGPLRRLARHVPRLPVLASVEARVELVAARPEVVRAGDQVQRVDRVDGNLRLVVRERIVAVELHVRRCLGNAALQLRLRSMLLIEAGALNRTFAGHPFRKVDLGARAPGDTEGQDCKGTRPNQPSMHYSPSSAPLGLTEG